MYLQILMAVGMLIGLICVVRNIMARMNWLGFTASRQFLRTQIMLYVMFMVIFLSVVLLKHFYY